MLINRLRPGMRGVIRGRHVPKSLRGRTFTLIRCPPNGETVDAFSGDILKNDLRNKWWVQIEGRTLPELIAFDPAMSVRQFQLIFPYE